MTLTLTQQLEQKRDEGVERFACMEDCYGTGWDAAVALLLPVVEAANACTVGDDADDLAVYAFRVNLTLNKALTALKAKLEEE